jgi:hypothetical protein
MPVTPVVFTPNRRNYKEVLDAIQQAAGEWIEIDQSRLAGATVTARQSALAAAGRRHCIKVETGTHQGSIYARLKPDNFFS